MIKKTQKKEFRHNLKKVSQMSLFFRVDICFSVLLFAQISLIIVKLFFKPDLNCVIAFTPIIIMLAAVAYAGLYLLIYSILVIQHKVDDDEEEHID